MNIYIEDAKTLQSKKMLVIYKDDNRSTFLGQPLNKTKNLLFVGFTDYNINYNPKEQIALLLWAQKLCHNKTCIQNDISKQELWSVHCDYVKKDFTTPRYKEAIELKLTARQRHNLFLVDRIRTLILSNQDIYLCYLSKYDMEALEFVKSYIEYAQKIYLVG